MYDTLILFLQKRSGEEDNYKVVSRIRIIGSRPPRCERRCSGCGHCEAVQVPVVPKVQTHVRRSSSTFSSSTTTRAGDKHVASSRGDDISNYKPMSWKCKCGDYFFNP